MTGAEYILKFLSDLNVGYLFTVPGAHIDPLIQATSHSEIRPVVSCHELGAGFMADGYSRANNMLGVVATIGGPGSNNLISAVNTSRIEKTPLLIITGDVPKKLSNFPGFQCANHLGSCDDYLFAGITKYSARIKTIAELPDRLNEAVRIAVTSPCGPSHLIIPYNFFKELLAKSTLDEQSDYTDLRKYSCPEFENTSTMVSKLLPLIAGDKKIILWAGDALNNRATADFVVKLAEKFHIPVATTFTAKGVIPENHALSLGNFGYAGNAKANRFLLSTDIDAIIGFDIEQTERNTLNWHSELYADKEIILLNHPSHFRFIHESVENHECNPALLLKRLYQETKKSMYGHSSRDRVIWLKNILENFDVPTPDQQIGQNDKIETQLLIKILRQELPKETFFFVDAGSHRIFAGPNWTTYLPRTFFSAAVTAPTGWGIAAGIGGKLDRKQPVVILTGDGCMQMHGIEIKTAVRYGIPIIIILCNNNALGSIYRRFSKVSAQIAEHTLIKEIDWDAFARSLGAQSYNVTKETDLRKAIKKSLKSRQVSLINVAVPLAPFMLNEQHNRSAFA